MRTASIKFLLVFVVTSITLIQQPVSAQAVGVLTAENLRDACDNLVLAVRGVRAISQEDPGAMLCLGYLAGWNQAMEMVPDKPYCLPAVETIQPGDLADLLVAYVDEHPEIRSMLAHTIMLKAFKDTFPCADPGESETEVDPE